MRVIYCERWNFFYGFPIDPLTEDQARSRNETGEYYSAALCDDDSDQPSKIVEVVWQNKHLGVWFLDELGRRALHYSFTRVTDHTLFLKSITRWQYPDETARRLNESELIEEITYRQDGVVRHDVTDDKAQEQRIVDRHSVVLDVNWDPVPAFGDWEFISRWDRQPSGMTAPGQATDQPAP